MQMFLFFFKRIKNITNILLKISLKIFFSYKVYCVKVSIRSIVIQLRSWLLQQERIIIVGDWDWIGKGDEEVLGHSVILDL